MIRFKIKENKDLEELTKFGFVNENKRYVLYGSVVKICVDKRTRQLRFNMPTNGDIAVYTRLVENGFIEIVENIDKPCRYHYIGLSDEEYELIQKRRIERNELL